MSLEEWSEEYVKKLAETGGNNCAATRAIGLHRNTPAHHLKRNESFRAQVERVLQPTGRR